MQGQRGSERVEAPRPLDELTATLSCAAAFYAVLLAECWFTAAIYSD